MRSLLRIVLMLPLLWLLAGPLSAEPGSNPPSSGEYLTWLSQRSNLWVSEMAQMEAHQHGQHRAEYRQLEARIAEAHVQAQALAETSSEPKRQERLETLIATVKEVELGLEFLLSETPQVAQDQP